MNTMMKTAIAFAAVALAGAPASAKTVAWYHFNEGASGTKPANAQPVFVNAADPGSLNATPRVRKSWSTAIEFVDNNTTYLPVYTNEFPSCASWFDPATGARGEDRRCLWMHTAYNYGHGDSPIVLVDDDAKLHCQNITAECMVKLTVPPDKVLSYQSHMLVMRNSPTSATTSNVKAWGLIINANGTVRVEMQTRDSTGIAADTSKNLSLVTPTSSPSVTNGKWHHVAFTYDGATVRIYVDYVERASQAWSEPIDYNEDLQGRLNIAGLDVSNYGGHWYGFVDEVRISDAALPPEKFLHVGGTGSSAMKVTDSDTALYLPFDSVEYSTDPFFGQEGSLLAFNSAAVPASNSNSLIRVNSVYLSNGGIRPIPDASSLAFDRFRNCVLADADAVNGGCWKFEENEDSSKIGWSVHLMVDDFTRNNNQHLITSGDFTIEFWLKSVKQQSATRNIIVEQSGTRNAATMRIYLDAA